jgi:hypothetical protein
MRWPILLLTAVPLLGQPAQLAYVGSTSTQIVFSYQSPDENACIVAAVNDDDSNVAVYDLDFNLFPAMPAVNSDFRHDWNIGKRGRIFVLGKRASDAGVDGRLYSRALEVDTPHTITVTCAGGSVTLKARTGRLPAGYTYPENAPFHPSGLGSWGWPSVDWSNRNHPLIDPMTGVKIKFATFPGDWANKRTGLFGTQFWVDWSGGHWSNPQNAVSGTTTSLSSYSNAGNEALFVGVDPALSVSNRLYGGWGGGEQPWSVDDFGVRVVGSGTDASSANRAVSVCLSIDSGQTCYTRSYLVVLPQGSAADTGVQPPSFPSPMFAGWSKVITRANLPTSGMGDIAGNILTLTGSQTGATFFNPELAAGSKIRIPGSSSVCAHELCTVQSVQDGSHLRLVENLNLTGVTFTLANFGVRVVKTTGTGSVALSMKYENAWSYSSVMPVTGASDMCGRVPVPVHVDAAGNPLPGGQVLTGYNCAIEGSWYWISTDTGESRLISLTSPPPLTAFAGTDPRDIPNVVQAPPGVGAFDLQNGNVAYTYAYLNQGGGRSLFRLTYNGDYRALNYNYPTGNGGEQPPTVHDQVTWTNLSPPSQGKDVMSQIRTRFKNYDETRFGQVSEFFGISGSYGMFLHPIGGQDSPCWVFFYNIQTQTLEHGLNSWDGSWGPYFRWAACHSGFPGSAPNTGAVATKPIYLNNPAVNYGGPFGTTVTALLRPNGVYDTANTALATDPNGSYDATCPGGLTGPYASLSGTNQCVTLRVAGEPCSAVATANEKGWSPCPWDSNRSMLQTMEVGDAVTNPAIGAQSERMMIVKKTILSPTNIELVLKRIPGPYCGILTIQRNYQNGWGLIMVTGGTDSCESDVEYVDPLNHVVYAENRDVQGGHFDFGVGSAPNTYSLVGQAFFGVKFTYAIRDSKPFSASSQGVDYRVTMEPKFSNVNSVSWTFLQMYGSKRQWNAPEIDRRWALDFRHLNGGFGIPYETAGTALAAAPATLVSGTSNVYQIGIAGEANAKKVPLLGYAGRFLLQEKSSPALGNTLTDADVYRFCYAYRNGECRQGSLAGQAFVSVPNATITGYCQAAQYARNIPCLMSNHPWGGWAIQLDTTKQDMVGDGVRRLTMGLTGPGRQYAYGNLRSLPDGKWALMSGWWIDGVRQDVLLVKLPPFRETDSGNRSDFVGVKVPIGPSAGASQAIVDFGYAEYGAPSSFQCTPRAERCSSVSATMNAANPFLFASEVTQGATCATGCTIQIPALPAHVLYYQIRYLNAAGATVQTLPMRILASPETGS